MKKILSLATVFALAFALNVAHAQDKPKTASKKAKTECSSKASKGCCAHDAKKAKKMAAKHECSEKCGDGCKTAHKAKRTSDAKKN